MQGNGLLAIPPTTTAEPISQTVKKHYPNWRVIVLNDEVNTFEHVIECFLKILPQFTPSKAERLAMQIHTQGAATAWSGAREQAEIYYLQLKNQGLTMAPLEQE